jgi:hypothetical protein
MGMHGDETDGRTLTFVVSTGRSGSTALSRVLSMHPDLLSVNELYSSLPDPDLLTDAPLSGPDFWQRLSSPNEDTDRMLRSGLPLPEIIYADGPGARRHSAATDGIPALCLMVLPHLTDDPDALLDALAPEVRAWPTRPVPAQWRALFATLAERFGASRAVVERSGFSLHRVTQLRACFPEARFVHLYRDGADCALSMSRHGGFRMLPLVHEMAALCGLSSFQELTPEHASQLPDDMADLLRGEKFDPSLVMDRDIPLAAFGALWSGMVVDGMQRLAQVPADRLMSLSYEELLREPAVALGRLADFVGVEQRADWLESGGGLLHSASAGSARRLPPQDLAALREACAPGTAALAGLAG